MVFKVKTLSDSAKCASFRAAIESGQDIQFDVKGTITLNSDLPPIDHKVVIVSSLDVIIDCNNHNGLVINRSGSGTSITGILITNSKGNGITLDNASNCKIRFSHVVNNRKNGIYVKRGGQNEFYRVLMSANDRNGIFFNESHDNEMKNNYIGVEATGTAAQPNKENGVYFYKSNRNTIGGKEYGKNNVTGSEGTEPPVISVPQLGNLISGNKNCGVLMEESFLNIFYGNFVGSDYNGLKPIGNEKDGVWLKNCQRIVLRGCNSTENPFSYYNVMVGNYENGLHVTSCTDIVIQGNFFGVGADNATIVPNIANGILIDGNSLRVLNGGNIPLGCVCSSNKKNGVHVTGNTKHYISFNTFAGLAAFQLALPNSENGILIDTQNTDPDHFTSIRTCVISGNRNDGISIVNTRSVIIDSVILGLSTKGSGFIPNERNNIYISNSSDVNIISQAKSVILTSNTIGGAHKDGVVITNGSHDCRIESAFIGCDILGATPIPNHRNGIVIEKGSHDNIINTNEDTTKSKQLSAQVQLVIDQIIAANPAANDTLLETRGPDNILLNGNVTKEVSTILEVLPNIISANDGVGVYLDETTYNNAVVNNYIGYSLKKEPLPNYRAQVINKSDRNIIKNNLIYHAENNV
jgi:parallel beta-helix repeat protein